MSEITNNNAIEIVKLYAEKLGQKIKINKIILFGSYAKNIQNKDSDIDIAIISSDFSGNIDQDFLLAMKISREIDLRIEPHPFLPQDFQEDPFAQEIINHGIEIKVA